jgi:hypothetical protein
MTEQRGHGKRKNDGFLNSLADPFSESRISGNGRAGNFLLYKGVKNQPVLCDKFCHKLGVYFVTKPRNCFERNCLRGGLL